MKDTFRDGSVEPGLDFRGDNKLEGHLELSVVSLQTPTTSSLEQTNVQLHFHMDFKKLKPINQLGGASEFLKTLWETELNFFIVYLFRNIH